MRLPVLVVSCSIAAILAVPPDAQAQAGDQDVAVSLDRIRAGLSRPTPLLKAAAASEDVPPPAFRAEVRASPFLQLPAERPFDPTYGLPSVAELLMRGIHKAVDYKRSRAERRAREEVAAAFAAFCAIQDCSPPTSSK